MIENKEYKKEQQTLKRKKIAGYLGWYTLLFALVSAGVFVWFLENQKSFCWTTDASSQYIPKVSYFITWVKETLQNLLNGERAFRMYDFHIGMGDSVPLHTEPLYWLYLLFDESQLEFAYGFLIVLRFYLSGLSLTIFLKYFHYDRWQCLTGSMVYVFSGYGLFAGMRHSHFIIPMMTLPMLLLAMEEIYRKKRWYLCTMFVAVSLWCGYYFTYMNTLLMGVYFLILFFCGEEKKSIREFLLRMRTIIGSYLLGIGIANITFFNTFADYLTSSRTGVTAEQRISLWNYGSGWIEKLYQSFLSAAITPGRWMWLGFIPLSYICVELLFLRKGNKTLKAAFVTGTVFCLIPAFGLVFSGFGALNNRWCYAIAMLVAVITAKMSEELKKMSGRDLLLTLLFALPYLYLGIGRLLLRQEYKPSVVVAGIGFLGTWIILLMLNYRKKIPEWMKQSAIPVIVVISLWVSGVYRYCGYFAGMAHEFTTAGKVIEQATDTPLKVLDELDDTGFYRSYSRKSESNVQGASMMLGYNGIVYYSSTLSKSMIDFYREMGLSSWSLVRVKGFDARGFLDTLACVKYQVPESDSDSEIPYGYEKVKEVLRDDVYYTICENQNVLPLGYCYDKVLSWENMEKLDTAQRQEAMLQAAIVENETVQDQNYMMDTSELTISGQKVPIQRIECSDGVTFDGKEIKVKKKNAEMTIWFDGLDDSETYINLESLSMKNASKVWFYFDADEGSYDISYYYHGDYNTYATGQEDYLFNLGYAEKGKTYCTIRFGKKCTMTVDDISVYCQPMEKLTEYVQQRKAASLENVTEEMNSVSGTIDTEKDQLLVLSIPYQNGWSAYVDGEKVPIRKVNIMYMGLDLKAGTHTVELHYEMPGIRISIVISVVSFGIFVAALMIRRKKRHEEK